MRRNRPKSPMEAYKQRLQEARKRIVDSFLEKVTKIIAGARRVHPRDESEPEKRLGIAFRLFSISIVKAALELRSILRRPLDRPAMLRLGADSIVGSNADDRLWWLGDERLRVEVSTNVRRQLRVRADCPGTEKTIERSLDRETQPDGLVSSR